MFYAEGVAKYDTTKGRGSAAEPERMNRRVLLTRAWPDRTALSSTAKLTATNNLGKSGSTTRTIVVQ